LAPLVALPILIHLLNRIRYRRVKWAAIEFLLTSERRAVRRAKLRHLILMALRTLLLAAALGVLAQPILKGTLASLLGATKQVAVVLDASASMSRTDASGSAFERAKTLATEAIEGLGHGTRATAGTFSVRYMSPFREPLLDRGAVESVVKSSELTGGSGDVATAIIGAAEALERNGGGGTIWLVTDLQKEGWRLEDRGAWEQARAALEKAGRPRVVVTDVGSELEANFSVGEVRLSPAVPIKSDVPKLVATIRLQGKVGGSTNVTLTFDEQRVDARSVTFDQPGQSEVAFHLPELKAGTHTGCLDLSTDALSADNRYYFVIHVRDRISLLVVDGAPSGVPFEGAADFLRLAIEPPEQTVDSRSPFKVKVITPGQLGGMNLKEYAAVVLADVAKLEGDAKETLEKYVQGGGLGIVFPGAHTDVTAWNENALMGVPIRDLAEAPEKESFKVTWTSPTNPVVSTMPVEGLERLLIKRMYRFGPSEGAVLATTDKGDAFVVRRQMGRGQVWVFSVSCQADFSNLPFTPALLLTMHRMVSSHMVQVGEPLSQPAFTPLELTPGPGRWQVVLPDGKGMRLTPNAEEPDRSTFVETGWTGIYRLVEGDVIPEKLEEAPILTAINVAPEESSLGRVEVGDIHEVLRGFQVSVLRTNGGTQRLGSSEGQQSAASSFPLAVLAVLFLVSEVVLGWSLDRPSVQAGSENGKAGSPA